MLEHVTITGADDSVDPYDLAKLSKRYPFVEWGILFSEKRQGEPEYPSKQWQDDVVEVAQRTGMRLSCHLCGKWLRELARGSSEFLREKDLFLDKCQRMQLNFFGNLKENRYSSLINQLKNRQLQYIIQISEHKEDEKLLLSLIKDGFNAVPLFDKSGGNGTSPGAWPTRIKHPKNNEIYLYCGYAGGLGPMNMVSEIKAIAKVVDHESDQYQMPVWIDMQTKVRSDDRKTLDLHKVENCLETAKRWTKYDS